MTGYSSVVVSAAMVCVYSQLLIASSSAFNRATPPNRFYSTLVKLLPSSEIIFILTLCLIIPIS